MRSDTHTRVIVFTAPQTLLKQKRLAEEKRLKKERAIARERAREQREREMMHQEEWAMARAKW